MVYLLNRVRTSVSGTPGTGTISLGSAVAGFQGFSAAGATDGYTYAYLLEDGDNWEVGIGTWSSSGNTLARTTVIQSSAGGTTPIAASSNTIVSVTMISNDGPLSVKIGQLDDVITSAPQMGQTLAWNGDDWINSASGGIGPVPSQTNTGLTTNINLGSGESATTIINSSVGICLKTTAPPGGGNVVAVAAVAPSTPYTITAQIAQTTTGNATCGVGIGWVSGESVENDQQYGSNAFHVFSSLANSNWEIEQWSSPTSFAGNSTSGGPIGPQGSRSFWMSIGDDGTNVSFGLSMDGKNFYTVYSIAKSSGYLGASGYTHVCFFVQAQGQANLSTLMSWDVGPASGGIGPAPSQTNTGLTTNINLGSGESATTIINSSVGICLKTTAPPGGGNVVAVAAVAPSTPYTITAQIAQTTTGNATCGVGIGWVNGSNAFHVFSLVSNSNWEIAKWSSPTSYAGNSATGGPISAQGSRSFWMSIGDDGTNVSFGLSMDGENFYTVYSVAKSSGYLGASGYTNVCFFEQAQGQANLSTLMSWDVSP